MDATWAPMNAFEIGPCVPCVLLHDRIGGVPHIRRMRVLMHALISTMSFRGPRCKQSLCRRIIEFIGKRSETEGSDSPLDQSWPQRIVQTGEGMSWTKWHTAASQSTQVTGQGNFGWPVDCSSKPGRDLKSNQDLPRDGSPCIQRSQTTCEELPSAT